MSDPSQVVFTLPVQPASTGGSAPGPMAFDAVRRRLYLAGCYQRFAGTGAGEPGTGKCAGVTSNLLRSIDVDARAAAQVLLYDLYNDVLSIDTTQILLADPDPATQAPTTIWASMHNPDSLVEVALPLQPSLAPRVRHSVPMPISPADILRIQRNRGKIKTPQRAGLCSDPVLGLARRVRSEWDGVMLMGMLLLSLVAAMLTARAGDCRQGKCCDDQGQS